MEARRGVGVNLVWRMLLRGEKDGLCKKCGEDQSLVVAGNSSPNRLPESITKNSRIDFFRPHADSIYPDESNQIPLFSGSALSSQIAPLLTQ